MELSSRTLIPEIDIPPWKEFVNAASDTCARRINSFREVRVMRIRAIFYLVWLLFSAFLVSCGISQEQLDTQATEIVYNIFATQTAAAPTLTLTPTNTPTTTATPTDTPTITLTPGPDLTQAVLTLNDLPMGFEDASDEFNIETGYVMDTFPYHLIGSFAFVEDCECEFIMGITMHLPWRSQQVEFDQYSAGLARIILESAGLFGGESEVKRPEELTGLEDIGNAVTGATTTMNSNGIKLRMDIVIFRRGIVGAWITVSYYEGKIPVASVDELSRKLDARIIDVVGSSSTPPEARKPTRFEVSVDDDPALGPANAPITIVEFSDYNCLHCKNFHTGTLQALMDTYPDQIRYVYRDFPISGSSRAAQASECADEQGAFWDYHDLLYTGRKELNRETLLGYAEELGLDADALTICLNEERYEHEVETDARYARSIGIKGVPTFFINGIPLFGDQPLENFIRVIEFELGNVMPGQKAHLHTVHAEPPTSWPLSGRSEL
jgi:protein-disulfide isomerase